MSCKKKSKRTDALASPAATLAPPGKPLTTELLAKGIVCLGGCTSVSLEAPVRGPAALSVSRTAWPRSSMGAPSSRTPPPHATTPTPGASRGSVSSWRMHSAPWWRSSCALSAARATSTSARARPLKPEQPGAVEAVGGSRAAHPGCRARTGRSQHGRASYQEVKQRAMAALDDTQTASSASSSWIPWSRRPTGPCPPLRQRRTAVRLQRGSQPSRGKCFGVRLAWLVCVLGQLADLKLPADTAAKDQARDHVAQEVV